MEFKKDYRIFAEGLAYSSEAFKLPWCIGHAKFSTFLQISHVLCWHPFKLTVSLIKDGEKILRGSKVRTFTFPFPSLFSSGFFPLPRSTNSVGKRKSVRREAAGSGLKSPAKLVKGQHGRDCLWEDKEAELLVSQPNWMAANLCLLPGPPGPLQGSVWPCIKKKYSVEIGSSFTFLGEQTEPGFSRGSRDRGQRGPNWYLLCQKRTGLFGKTETK